MDDIVSKTLIKEYAKRNTSDKMPIESKYVEAFLDSILNSTAYKEKIEYLKNSVANGDSFFLMNSIDKNCKLINYEPLRSIVGYSMNRKDMILFEMINGLLFTGEVRKCYGENLDGSTVTKTDEPNGYTDQGGHTDSNPSLIVIDYLARYCPSPVIDDFWGNIGTDVQSKIELENQLEVFNALIPIVKPSRIDVIVRYNHTCYAVGKLRDNVADCLEIGCNTNSDNPFKNTKVLKKLSKMTVSDLSEFYKANEVDVYTLESGEKPVDRNECIRTIKVDSNYVTFLYNIRVYIKEYCERTEENSNYKHIVNPINKIVIRSDKVYILYVESEQYKPNTEYYQKFEPVMLKMGDGSDDVLSFNGNDDMASVFYERT